MKRLLYTLLFCLAIAYIVLQYLDNAYIATGIKALFLISLTVLYNFEVKEKRLFFSLFLITFTIGEIIYFSTWNIVDAEYKSLYYITNMFFIVSYIFLIIRILMDLDVREILRKYPAHLVVLSIMGVFSVYLISGATQQNLGSAENILEISYNGIVMTLLSLALVNYIIKENKKAMNFLVGSIFIVFSEMLQYVYFYVVEETVVNVLGSIFNILGFSLFFIAARLKAEDEEDFIDSELHKLHTNS